MDLKDTKNQDLWEPLDGELLYTSFSGSAATACLKDMMNRTREDCMNPVTTGLDLLVTEFS